MQLSFTGPSSAAPISSLVGELGGVLHAPWLPWGACVLLTLALCVQGVSWQQARLQLRRLAVLAEVSRLSNPRFGADATLARVLECIRAHLHARSCQLVLRPPGDTQAWLHSALASGGAPGLQPQALKAQAAARLLPFAPDLRVRHVAPGAAGLRRARTEYKSAGPGPWLRASPALAGEAAELAGLLEARSLISIPVALHRGAGCLLVCSDQVLQPRDADFLELLARHALAGVDQVDLLDRLASSAASRERRKWALDLHDTAIQPYIGLRMGLGALRQKAAAGLPVADGLAQLEELTGRVLEDLRQHARQGRDMPGAAPLLRSELEQQAAQAQALYGLDIALQLPGELAVGDRLSVEVLHLVREGLSNIGRHTQARRGEVRLTCRDGWLDLCIANEAEPCSPTDFSPRSLGERAAALGGQTQVQRDPQGRTAVHIRLPV